MAKITTYMQDQYAHQVMQLKFLFAPNFGIREFAFLLCFKFLGMLQRCTRPISSYEPRAADKFCTRRGPLTSRVQYWPPAATTALVITCGFSARCYKEQPRARQVRAAISRASVAFFPTSVSTF
jgi:hypothetical protein